MSCSRKKNSDKIKKFIRNLKAKQSSAQSWWPDYIYRVDNITAAVNILKTGKLFSREAAQSNGLIVKDCASPDIIGMTDPKWLQYVRLYFRPRTPTQFANEGFRPPDKLKYRAHCPVPIVMLFDSYDLLTREATIYSNGNLAKDALTGNSYNFLKKLPFDKIYHNTYMDEPEKVKIKFHRHAEVAIPNELDLSALRFIGCRTQAEYETLIHLLDLKTYRQWSRKIGVRSTMHLHNRIWTFVENVELGKTQIKFQFNPSSKTPGPFKTQVEIEVEETSKNYYWEENFFMANSILTMDISSIEKSHAYLVRLLLNDDIAYVNRYFEINTPF